MVQVVWTRRASADVWAIRSYIEQFTPMAAGRFAARLKGAAESLESQPDRGRAIGYGLRELVIVRPYIIVYRVMSKTVEILTVRHGARLR